MPDPLRVKLVSESAAGIASASISPPGATRNWVRLACVTCYEMLRFAPFWGILPPFCHPIGFESGSGQPLSGTQGKSVATFALVTMVGTIATSIVYDNVTQGFGHKPVSGAMRCSQEPNNWLHS